MRHMRTPPPVRRIVDDDIYEMLFADEESDNICGFTVILRRNVRTGEERASDFCDPVSVILWRRIIAVPDAGE
jgi:hypothetical protein